MTSQPAHPVSGAIPPVFNAEAPLPVLARLRASAVDFMRAWGRPRLVERRENLRVLEALATLATVAGIVAIGAFYDVAVTRWAGKLDPAVHGLFAQITKIGASGYIFAISAIVTLAALLLRNPARRRRANAALSALAGRAFFIFVVAAVSGIASQIVKHLFGRARPKLLDIVGPMHFDAFSFDATFASFPSGHAVTAFAMVAALAAMAPKLRLPLLAVAVLVAASRVIIGAHYLSDVLAGAGLGYGSAILVRRAFAARSIVFRQMPGGLRLRGAGLVRGLFQRGAR